MVRRPRPRDELDAEEFGGAAEEVCGAVEVGGATEEFCGSSEEFCELGGGGAVVFCEAFGPDKEDRPRSSVRPEAGEGAEVEDG